MTSLNSPAYRERLHVSWWAWPAGLAMAGLVAAQVHGGHGGLRAVLPYVLLLPLAVAGLLALSRNEVRVADGVLHVPGARAPLTALGDAVPLDAAATRQLLGPRADPRAHVATRPWVSTSVRVAVDDPEDDTPYWVVSTRSPQRLVEALEAARTPTG